MYSIEKELGYAKSNLSISGLLFLLVLVISTMPPLYLHRHQ
jgi:hypothetical protein